MLCESLQLLNLFKPCESGVADKLWSGGSVVSDWDAQGHRFESLSDS